MELEIDIVVPWVDGSDPEWKKIHDQFVPNTNSDDAPSRYRKWDTFRFWFRAIELNAPWVRKIHFLTFKHLPTWLNTSHPKLNIVEHQEFIPNEYLPTFSSHVIELNLHRIPDLAEHFIYFNDDVYLINRAEKSDFFRNNLPCDSAILGVIKNNNTENFMPYIMLNMMAIVNMKFAKSDVFKSYHSKWFTPRYGKYLLNNIYLSPFPYFTGFRNFHSATPFCKDTFIQVWEEIPEILRTVCSHKFRSKSDVNQYLFRYWQILSGKFQPVKPRSDYITIGKASSFEIEKMVNKKSNLIVCINDDPGDFDINKQELDIKKILLKKFPNKSNFEID